jgi:hypothetical protein
MASHLKVVVLEDARVFWISLDPVAPAAAFVPTAFALAHASAAVAVSAVDAAAPSAVSAPDLPAAEPLSRVPVLAAAAAAGVPVPAVRAAAPALAAAFYSNWGSRFAAVPFGRLVAYRRVEREQLWGDRYAPVEAEALGVLRVAQPILAARCPAWTADWVAASVDLPMAAGPRGDLKALPRADYLREARCSAATLGWAAAAVESPRVWRRAQSSQEVASAPGRARFDAFEQVTAVYHRCSLSLLAAFQKTEVAAVE